MDKTIPILMYHQIDTPPPRGVTLRGLVVAPSSFAWQMRMLNMMGYQGLSMRELEPYLSNEMQGKVVGITFDDGYLNNLQHALPILCKYGFTATCYGVSNLLGQSNIWDRGLVAETPLMTVQDWRNWHAAGMDVGSHTRTHAKLTEVSHKEALEQILYSKLELEQSIGCNVRHFCYPYGGYSKEHIQMVQAAGYVTATTTNRGHVRVCSDPFTLSRILIARSTNPLLFFLKIATSYENRRR